MIFCRNLDKKSALGYKNLIFLVLKIVLDSMSRILIFSAWMYTSNEGQFSTWRTVAAFYGTFMILIAYNIYFSFNRNVFSTRYWIGTYLILALYSSKLFNRYSTKFIELCSFVQ